MLLQIKRKEGRREDEMRLQINRKESRYGKMRLKANREDAIYEKACRPNIRRCAKVSEFRGSASQSHISETRQAHGRLKRKRDARDGERPRKEDPRRPAIIPFPPESWARRQFPPMRRAGDGPKRIAA